MTDPTVPAAPLDCLCREQTRLWQQGRRVLVEEHLASHPRLRDDAAALLVLIYHEIAEREKRGNRGALGGYAPRFPAREAALRPKSPLHEPLKAGADLAPIAPSPGPPPPPPADASVVTAPAFLVELRHTP